jgi:hypothetical protein
MVPRARVSTRLQWVGALGGVVMEQPSVACCDRSRMSPWRRRPSSTPWTGPAAPPNHVRREQKKGRRKEGALLEPQAMVRSEMLPPSETRCNVGRGMEGEKKKG